MTWLWPGRRRAPLAAPGFRLLEGGAGRHDAARRLPRVRRGRRIGAVGGARQLEELLRGLLGRPIGRVGGRTEALGVPGVPQPHPRNRRTGREDQTPASRRPQDNRAWLSEREARGVRQREQGHRPRGLRLPPRHQPHQPDHAQMRRTRHPTTGTSQLTHENSRSLKNVCSKRV